MLVWKSSPKEKAPKILDMLEPTALPRANEDRPLDREAMITAS